MKAVFIDRDGTIGGGDEVTFPQEFKLFPFSRKAIDLLKNKGYKLFAFTNQPDLSEGKVAYKDFETELNSLGFDDLCICPHRPVDHCKCRKPSAYMINQMEIKYHLQLSECFVIGDRWSDMASGISAGTKVILVRTGAGNGAMGLYSNQWNPDRAAYIAEDLLDAVRWILNHA
ncbi:D-glycero-beta-D-manno-heptose-1,7-bisphosphate 7-phosphatase [Caprobacter fermentans]|uniref:D,D-heptose 1,7-bisphosphate phosphatase n=1 Tax=Caproicibacter fermentans TaxID=2576756 RepID=A0A6N8HW69_9FIRM|nr:HAD-IIIA family hydrolase [Caproicibacter fermentans]MVB10051.1 D-glycero-beta-D-manno-heptose-1,7-bisphosphate 7-phosphatase [Caproicibacter fermentans]